MAETWDELRTREAKGWTLWVVKGRLDRMTAQAAGEQAEKVFAGTQKLAVDLSGLEYLSSAGIRVLLRLSKQAKAAGKDFALVGPSGMVHTVVTEARMDMFVAIYESEDQLP